MAKPKSSAPNPEKEKNGLKRHGAGRFPAEEVCKELLTMQQDCMRALNEIQMRVQRNCNQTQVDFAHMLYEAQLTSGKSQHEAYRDYVLGVQDVAGRQDAAQRVRDVEERYIRDSENGKAQIIKTMEEAESRTRTNLEENIDQANKDWDKACVSYLKGIKDRFCQLDAETADPEVVALVGQSLLWASNHLRSATTGRPS